MFDSLFKPLEKALQVYAVLAVVIVIAQCLGLAMYLVEVWPTIRPAVSGATSALVTMALVCGFVRSCVWIRIYWSGARALSLLRVGPDSAALGDRLAPVLAELTRLLVASCVLDVLLLPVWLFGDLLLPASVAGWRLGVIELARLVFPQAFGFAALILAFLTRHYGLLLKERGRMQHELELTI